MVNELKMLFDRMGIDIWEVIEGAKTKPFGFQATDHTEYDYRSIVNSAQLVVDTRNATYGIQSKKIVKA